MTTDLSLRVNVRTTTVGRLSILLLYVAGGRMNCVSRVMCVYHLWFALRVCLLIPEVFFHHRVIGVRPVTTDLIMPVRGPD